MKSANIYSILIAYLLIIVGLGVLIEVNIRSGLIPENISTGLSYFFWSLNGLTFAHLVFLIPYQTMKNEEKKSKSIFFLVVNHFVVSLMAILIYALVFFKGDKIDGMVAVSIYSIVFTLYCIILTWQSKK